MKKLIYILLVLFPAIIVNAQETYPMEYSSLITDRAFFVSGEQINYSGLIYSETSDVLLSKVVYIELIDPFTNKINQQKHYLKDGTFSGSIIIPESTISGYYFLRAYTKWMRNSNPDYFGKVMVKIVNPFIMDLQQIPDSLLLHKKTSSASFIFDMEPSFQTNYQPNENISVPLSHFESENNVITQISIVPAQSNHFIEIPEKNMPSHFNDLKYIPETQGLSLSGKVLFNEEASPYHLIYLNMMGEKDFISMYSDSLGHFNFSLPHEYESRELMIGAAYKEGGFIDLLIDNDYDITEEQLKVLKFGLSDEEQELSLLLAKQYQINKWYYDSIKQEEIKLQSIPFYQQSFKTIDFDFYVPLDSLSQYFTDLPSYVQVKKRRGKRYLQVIGEESGLMVYEPLTMVDWIPVDEADRILAMNPANIKKIDVINRLYYHGNKTFGGIIHIQTRDRNMADLKFPESNIYLNYQFPLAENKAKTELEFPGTYYFNVLPEDHEEVLNIPAPNISGDYVLLIQIIEKSGNSIKYPFPFSVE